MSYKRFCDNCDTQLGSGEELARYSQTLNHVPIRTSEVCTKCVHELTILDELFAEFKVGKSSEVRFTWERA